MSRIELGVGLQLDPATIPLLGDLQGTFDFGELLCDLFLGPMDSGYVVDPLQRPLFDRLRREHRLTAHSNYGEDFGWKPIDETVCAQRHIPIAREMDSPLLHENAFYYAPFPGSDIGEAEFVAEVVQRAGTWLMLDLHNVHANAMNFRGYDPARFSRPSRSIAPAASRSRTGTTTSTTTWAKAHAARQ